MSTAPASGAQPPTPPLVVGIFVGGRGRRMGGVAKGLLPAPDTGEPLAARLRAVAGECFPAARCVLVGAAEAYAALGMEALADSPPGVGPIGGLRSLLECAASESALAIAVACDLPRVGAASLRQLGNAGRGPAVVAPRVDGIWQPLFARYEPALVLPALSASIAAREHALQRVLARLGDAVVELPLSDRERADLGDWDEPSDLGG